MDTLSNENPRSRIKSIKDEMPERVTENPSSVINRMFSIFLVNSCRSHYHILMLVFREFMENEFVNFAKNNQSVAVYAHVRRHRSPKVVAEYCKYRSI